MGEYKMEEEKIYNKEWFMWVMLALVTPVGIYIMWKENRLKITTRIISTFLFCMIVINFLQDLSTFEVYQIFPLTIILTLITFGLDYILTIKANSKMGYVSDIKCKTWEYTICEKNNSLYIYKNQFLKSSTNIKPTVINSINDIRIYEDDKEKSAVGKAIVGGFAFGLTGAVIGSSMRKELVRKMGVKIYTDQGVFDFKTIHADAKKDGFVYDEAEKKVDELYNTFIKYVRRN